MCGITGYYAYHDPPGEEELEKSCDSLSHRGPDARGIFRDGTIGLAHRRLSIIDTSEAANQPFFSKDNNNLIVFNGEIYNFREIALKYNLPARTKSDTEILLEAFIQEGVDILKELNGMFSFVIFNRENKRLFACRDRLGIKPFYYFYNDRGFYFASEIKALKVYRQVDRRLTINRGSIREFLHLGYIPEPETLYSELKQLKAGHYMFIDENGLKEQCYYDVPGCISRDLITDESGAISELRNLITSAVNYRLICDVPFGTFLSGGVDSSLVTAVAAQKYPGKLKTFSIGFNEAAYDESRFACAVSSYLGTDHHEFRVAEKEALELMDTSLASFDQPFADSSALPTMLVSRLAASEVKMVLTGDGGDELFMGYGAYRWAERMNKPFLKRNRRLISLLLGLGNSRYKRVACMFNFSKDEDIREHVFSQEQYLFTRQEISRLMMPDFVEKYHSEAAIGRNRLLTPAEEQALYDIKNYLKDDLLVKVDRASMFSSLECRLPLLDYRIVEWSLNLDPQLKMKGQDSKYLLKKLLYSYLPEEFFHRPKQGFAVPLSRWLNGPLSNMVDEYLSQESIRGAGFVNYNEVRKLINNYKSGRYDYLYNRIWALIVLHKMSGYK